MASSHSMSVAYGVAHQSLLGCTSRCVQGATISTKIMLINWQLCLQDAIWEAEFQAQEWQQHLLQQRMARRSSLQRCGPSRSVTMPSTTQHCTSQFTADKPGLVPISPLDCSHFAAAAAHGDTCEALATVREHCVEEQPTDHHLPLIRVPSSLIEVNSSPSASKSALVSSRSSGASTSGSLGVAYVAPYMRPFGSSSKTGRQRRMPEASQTANPSLQTVLGLAAKVQSPPHASSMRKGGQAPRGRGRAQSSLSATARVKASQGNSCRSSNSKNKTSGDQWLRTQGSCTEFSSSPQRYRI